MRTFAFILISLFLSACYSAPHPLPPQNTPIPTQGEMCGGIAGMQCSVAGEYCHYTPQAQCGAADQSGTCMPKTQMCTRDYRPVCGCDGKTYSNACTAASNGMSVVHEGQCRQ